VNVRIERLSTRRTRNNRVICKKSIPPRSSRRHPRYHLQRGRTYTTLARKVPLHRRVVQLLTHGDVGTSHVIPWTGCPFLACLLALHYTVSMLFVIGPQLRTPDKTQEAAFPIHPLWTSSGAGSLYPEFCDLQSCERQSIGPQQRLPTELSSDGQLVVLVNAASSSLLSRPGPPATVLPCLFRERNYIMFCICVWNTDRHLISSASSFIV